MPSKKTSFNTFMGVKSLPNDREIALFERAKKYSRILERIPGIQMIAVVNSLSMNATHEESDIDLFIITRPHSIWFVRFFSTLILWICGVWRHGKDIQGHFCLSFFATTESMNLEKIAIENDIYLTYWIEYMKITYDAGGIYEQFMGENEWRKELLNEDIRSPLSGRKTAHGETEGDTLFEADEKRYSGGAKANEFVSPSELLYTFPYKSMGRKNPRFPPAREGQEQENIGTDPSFVGMTKEKEGQTIVRFLNSIIRAFLLPRTKRSYEKLRRPEGVIISDTMLKFHDRDRRREIRDAIIGKNFDK